MEGSGAHRASWEIYPRSDFTQRFFFGFIDTVVYAIDDSYLLGTLLLRTCIMQIEGVSMDVALYCLLFSVRSYGWWLGNGSVQQAMEEEPSPGRRGVVVFFIV